MPASRQIARELEENVAFRVLAANQRPDFRTISDFRQQHLVALTDLFVQVLTLCQKAGWMKLGHLALDGTKVQANASKHKAVSYERMGKEEARLQAEVAALLKAAETADAQDDAAYGPDRRGDELPAEVARREQRLARPATRRGLAGDVRRSYPVGSCSASPAPLHRSGEPDHAGPRSEGQHDPGVPLPSRRRCGRADHRRRGCPR